MAELTALISALKSNAVANKTQNSDAAVNQLVVAVEHAKTNLANTKNNSFATVNLNVSLLRKLILRARFLIAARNGIKILNPQELLALIQSKVPGNKLPDSKLSNALLLKWITQITNGESKSVTNATLNQLISAMGGGALKPSALNKIHALLNQPNLQPSLASVVLTNSNNSLNPTTSTTSIVAELANTPFDTNFDNRIDTDFELAFDKFTQPKLIEEQVPGTKVPGTVAVAAAATNSTTRKNQMPDSKVPGTDFGTNQPIEYADSMQIAKKFSELIHQPQSPSISNTTQSTANATTAQPTPFAQNRDKQVPATKVPATARALAQSPQQREQQEQRAFEQLAQNYGFKRNHLGQLERDESLPMPTDARARAIIRQIGDVGEKEKKAKENCEILREQLAKESIPYNQLPPDLQNLLIDKRVNYQLQRQAATTQAAAGAGIVTGAAAGAAASAANATLAQTAKAQFESENLACYDPKIPKEPVSKEVLANLKPNLIAQYKNHIGVPNPNQFDNIVRDCLNKKIEVQAGKKQALFASLKYQKPNPNFNPEKATDEEKLQHELSMTARMIQNDFQTISDQLQSCGGGDTGSADKNSESKLLSTISAANVFTQLATGKTAELLANRDNLYGTFLSTEGSCFAPRGTDPGSPIQKVNYVSKSETDKLCNSNQFDGVKSGRSERTIKDRTRLMTLGKMIDSLATASITSFLQGVFAGQGNAEVAGSNKVFTLAKALFLNNPSKDGADFSRLLACTEPNQLGGIILESERKLRPLAAKCNNKEALVVLGFQKQNPSQDGLAQLLEKKEALKAKSNILEQVLNLNTPAADDDNELAQFGASPKPASTSTTTNPTKTATPTLNQQQQTCTPPLNTADQEEAGIEVLKTLNIDTQKHSDFGPLAYGIDLSRFPQSTQACAAINTRYNFALGAIENTDNLREKAIASRPVTESKNGTQH